jgi:hypothetical protein
MDRVYALSTVSPREEGEPSQAGRVKFSEVVELREMEAALVEFVVRLPDRGRGKVAE